MKTKIKVVILLLLSIVIVVGFGSIPQDEFKPVSKPVLKEKKKTNADLEKLANDNLAKTSKNQKLKLQLQTNEKYANKSYGIGTKENTIAKNGCALTSLAMVHSFYAKKNVNINNVLKWSHNDYFLKGEGTLWSIFDDYANTHGLKTVNLNNNYKAATKYLNKGLPIIVSAKKGSFTKVGHIMVITKDKNNKLRVYDPNDSYQKKHYEKPYNKDQIKKEIVNYWYISPK